MLLISCCAISLLRLARSKRSVLLEETLLVFLLRTLLPLASDVDLDLDLMSDEISLAMDSVGCLAELSASPEFLVLSNGLLESNVMDGKCDLL